MRSFRFVAIGLLVVVASVFGWRAVRTGMHVQTAPLSVQPTNAQPVSPQLENSGLHSTSTTAQTSESAKHLGHFSIAGRDYTVDLDTKKIQPGSTGERGDTVVAMEIKDTEGAVQYRRTFPYMEAKEDYFESWSVSVFLLTGTNGTGLLVSYGVYSEPSAPEEEPTGWFQVFGVVNGKFVPFGAPLEVQGGLLDEYVGDHTYRAARSPDGQTDAMEFKAWTGHCRLIYPVRVDWAQGKLSPAQECTKSAGALSAGCEYQVVPEDKLYTEGITFVRLWARPDEQSGKPVKTVVKKDSKVGLLTALVATRWVEGSAAGPSANSKGLMDEAGGFGVAADTDLWLKVHIDGKEGWMHSEEDFRALGLPQDQ